MDIENLVKDFEEWYCDMYSWEIKRGQRGRLGKHLMKYEDIYISDHARDNWSVWVGAAKRYMK